MRLNRVRRKANTLVIVLVGLGMASSATAGGVAKRGMARPHPNGASRSAASSMQSSPVGRSGDVETPRNVAKRQSLKRAGAASPEPTVLAGVPSNDACANALPINGTGMFPFDTTGATAVGPNHDGCIDPAVDTVGAIAHDVWFCWTSPCSGAVEITTCGTTGVDTKIAVYKGCNLPDGTANCPPADEDLFPFSCNDDAEGGGRCGLQSSATILAEAGASYLIRVGTYPGDATLGLAPAPVGPGDLQITCVDLPCQDSGNGDRCQPPHRFSGTGTNGVDFRVVDDFTAVETGEITELCWWGSYLFDIWDPGTWPDTFEIRYFADQGGIPGALIGGPFVQGGGTLSVSPAVDTGIGDSFRVFEYTAVHGGTCSVSGSACDVWGPSCPKVCAISHDECSSIADCAAPGDTCSVVQNCNPVGVPVTAGSCYWIEIVNNTDPNAWFWQDGVGGDIAALQDGDDNVLPDGYDSTDVIANDLAYCLDVSNASCHDSPCAGATGNCCEVEPISTPGCEDPECCARVCACDPICCSDSGWDEFCQGTGFNNSGCGAAALCADTCAGCPDGPVSFLDPLVDPVSHPDGLVDARQPSPISDGGMLKGFQSFFVEAPLDASTSPTSGCWSLCETGDNGTANRIERIISHGDGTYTINLERPITPGELTTLTYTSDTGVTVTERFASLPGDTNADRLVTAADINHLIDCINQVTPIACDVWQTDIDRSTVTNAQDILRVIDLLNGAGDFDVWLAATVGTQCPAP